MKPIIFGILTISCVLIGCSTSPSAPITDTNEVPQNNGQTQQQPQNQGLSALEQQYQQYYTQEGKQRVAIAGQGRQQMQNQGYERADSVNSFVVYSRIQKNGSSDALYVAVYTPGGEPVTRLEYLNSTNKRGGIMVGDIRKSPYMHSSFFFETLIDREELEDTKIYFVVDEEEYSYSVTVP